ncbi:MAG: MerC family mercury resistance protein [Xanthomonadaceae bacterium]|nr:MerC family mercury resistance protein [Xanthomonadaceae bacterium]MDE1963401.1 MerC domain-containing protein [Xanthomonadaceae bacterium]
MQPEPSEKSFWWTVADRIGATASFLCAIHCAALPFVLAILPLVGLEFLASHAFERGFVMFACALALFSLGRGYRRHRMPQPLTFALPGLLLLLLGVTVAEGVSITVHSVLVTIGGLLLAFSHFLNLRAERLNGHIHGPTCIH